MCILIEIIIKIYFINVAAGNGPKVQSSCSRAPATNRRHAHATSMQRTLVNTHTTATLAREDTPATATRERTHGVGKGERCCSSMTATLGCVAIAHTKRRFVTSEYDIRTFTLSTRMSMMSQTCIDN